MAFSKALSIISGAWHLDFTAALLGAVVSSCILAFVFGAGAEAVLLLLTLGLVTAVLEARLRAARRP
ncbi:hypothetical protein IP86_13910 [Rhodopseudomonas sp. AAP120]|uniref:hypothetical protein n=1 Tax=Rhodopseudomonas sp. AAP120 TaxID=1523430 RepID=UPI0006B8ADAA|nr:hypothetical protein [Rhodopseudomonas sp. AAP120]KPF97418.1 hypothetical protein IP86_13910 [Rhodopseudomonas sp. AAP120]